MDHHDNFLEAAQQLIEAGRFVDSRAWVPATSGNFSARLANGNIAITVSGKHKGRLRIEDIMVIDADGLSLDDRRPSAETLLHTSLYKRYPEVHAVLHPHPLHATLVSRLFGTEIVLQDYELLKAFAGIMTHESRLVVPIFANDQDISRLSGMVGSYLDAHADCPAYIIAGHGIYTWGATVEQALCYLEALDFLFACELRLLGVRHQ